MVRISFDFVQPVGDSINVGIKLLKYLFDTSPSQKLVISVIAFQVGRE